MEHTSERPLPQSETQKANAELERLRHEDASVAIGKDMLSQDKPTGNSSMDLNYRLSQERYEKAQGELSKILNQVAEMQKKIDNAKDDDVVIIDEKKQTPENAKVHYGKKKKEIEEKKKSKEKELRNLGYGHHHDGSCIQ